MIRIISLASSIVIFLILLIPLIIISILIISIDREKPFYFSSRIGRNKKEFTMPKFRTMKSSTPQQATHLLKNPEQYILKTGGFIRKYSLDELPQIICVILGDMSLVGPRPALFNQDDLINLRDKFGINNINPGITGWAQVNGRDELEISKKVEYDLEYLKKSSIFFDFKILWLTLIKVIKKDGISH